MPVKQLTDEQWKKKLTPEQYRMLREKGTEAPFTNDLVHNDKEGSYTCAACGAELFDSDTKFESTTPGLIGWPSFSDVKNTKAVKLHEDHRFGMHRVEVSCANCGSHLGHVFSDAPDQPTGTHFCINSTCLGFKPVKTKGNQ